MALQAFALTGCAQTESASSGKNELVYCNGALLDGYMGAPNPPAARVLTKNGGFEDYPEDLFPLSATTAEEPLNVLDIVSSGDVEVFRLDEQVTASRALPELESKGVPALSDPDVMVYPFEGSQDREAASGFPVLQPPVSERSGFPSPFIASEDGPRMPEPLQVAEKQYKELKKPSQQRESIFFAHDSAKVEDRSKRILTAVAEDVRGSGKSVFVEGHASRVAVPADEKEKEIVNLRKSLDRAFAVSSTLIREGVPAERISTCAFGDTQPPELTGGKDKEAASRRVEIHTGY